jgi:fermentation-respiration switch protein FrsA (DUF1100 family)
MTVIMFVLGASALFVLWVRWMEPRSLYYPQRGLGDSPARLGWRFEDVRLQAADGVRLHGWFIPAGADTSGPDARSTVLYLHGNAGNVSHRLEKLAILRDLGADVLIVDYRGYGLSEGRPHEHGLYRDARAAYVHLVSGRGVDPRRIVLLGESLGSAVASHLASEHETGGVVLEEAFTSIADVAQDMFPVLPVRWVMRSRYDTLDRIARIRAPILILHSRGDEYFPYRHAERLAAAAPGAKLVELRGGHNDAFLVSEAEYRRALAELLSRVSDRAAGEGE